ncbi:MAG: hypothetical protein CEN88_240 [Candidatus Berkelbacteria bacterium Licking1014_2]|uniref:DUF5678 domain-containing protein n=1 Tax=Candidatus Berkelbacteria bacterium Licking1014_2 TaxID=2017146 RepID=A0A554LVU2_9BACT|nr:MAG: hypothetical protein CEN88_240 [Candidatus Berkelbacteria bacterium Licking1014_2]
MEARTHEPLDEYAHSAYAEFETNSDAYNREEPSLLGDHRGDYAVFCDGKLAAVASNMTQAIRQAREAYPEAHPYVRQVGTSVLTRPRGRP